MKWIEGRVTGLSFITPTVFELSFSMHPPVSFQAGQFISIVIPGRGPQGRDLRRAYSFASPPEAAEASLWIKKVEGGPGSTYLSQLRKGDSFRAMAPYGNFVYHPQEGYGLCFLATGTGIAPLRSLVLSKAFQENPPNPLWVCFGVRTEEERLFWKELQALPSLHWIETLSRPSPSWEGKRGHLTHWLKEEADSVGFPWNRLHYYLCGNGNMIREVREFLIHEKKIDKTLIHQEAYYTGGKTV